MIFILVMYIARMIDFFTLIDCCVVEFPKFFDSFSKGSLLSVTIVVDGFWIPIIYAFVSFVIEELFMVLLFSLEFMSIWFWMFVDCPIFVDWWWIEFVRVIFLSVLVSKFLLSLMVSFSKTFSLLSIIEFCENYFTCYVFCGNWLIDREITLGEITWFLSDDRNVIFVIEVLWLELILWDSLVNAEGLIVYWVVIAIVGLKVYATNEAFSSGINLLLSGESEISIDCFTWRDWRNVLPLLMCEEIIYFS